MPKLRFRSAPANPSDPSQERRGGVPVSVWMITGLWAALLLGASLLWPMTYGYDEPQHIDMAYVYSSHPFHFYAPGKLPPTRANVAVQLQQPGYPPTKSFAATPIPARGQRKSFSELGGHASATGTQPNQMVQHPPLYYWLEAAVLRIPGVSHLAWDVQVWLMRLLSVLIMLPVPLLCWASTRRLLDLGGPASLAGRLAPLAAAVPLTVPNLIRDGSSVNNDSLLILTTSVVLWLLTRVLTGDLSRRTAVWLAVALAAALLTKGFALGLPVAILVTYLVAGRRHGGVGERMRSLAVPIGIAAIGGIIGGLWWLHNLIDYGSVQVDGYGKSYERVLHGIPDYHGTLVRFAPNFVTDFTKRIWGGIGLPDAPSDGPFAIYGWFVVAAIGIVAALLIRARAGDRARASVLMIAPVLTVAGVAASSYSGFHKWSSAVRGSQGRYVYHLVVVLAALIAFGWIRLVQPRLAPALTPIVVAGALVTNAATWFIVLRSWYQPKDGGITDAAHSLLRWSPVPSAVTITLVAVVPVVAGVAALIATSAEAGRLRAAILTAIRTERPTARQSPGTPDTGDTGDSAEPADTTDAADSADSAAAPA